ncbi:tyrosine-type recombinase/integrase [Streptomyces sp. NPDC096310]|uniref:tyrosine-type recombinase/integrase n=1 Tax=Streptomyces sp. NPDC096310 TaxID=3366082 RepID=UPI0037F83CE6
MENEKVRLRPFVVRMPSGDRYWTVLDEDELAPIAEVDEFLRHVRFGRDQAESTTATYAGAIKLFLTWCARSGLHWRECVGRLGSFMFWLRYARLDGDPVVPGPGQQPVRGPRRVNTVLAGVREFLKHQVAVGNAPVAVLGMLYEVADDRDLPVEVRGEASGPRYYARARHRAAVPDAPVDRASDDEVVALLRACRTARDRLIVLLMARAGLRRGEAVGLRREDIHFVVDARHLGCSVPGSHLHVVRRDNGSGAWAKSRRSRAVPVDFLVVQAFDQYAVERARCAEAALSDMVLVNLARPPAGAPVKPGAVNELLVRLSRRAGLERVVHPHSLRHAFATNVVEAGAAIDEVQQLLGHRSVTSTQVYLHPSPQRLRAAVDRVGSLVEEVRS